MKRFILGSTFIVLLLSSIFAHAETDSQAAVKSFVGLYNKSASMNELIHKMPNFGPAASEIHRTFLGNEIDKPLPTLGFDLSESNLSIRVGKVDLKVLNLAEGEFEINKKRFKWEPKNNYYENLDRLLESQAQRKTSAWMFLMPNADAQERAAFPELNEAQQNDAINKNFLLIGILGPIPLSTVTFTRIATGASVNVGALAVVGLATDYLVNIGHSALAPSCEQQTLELQKIMNAQHISLSSLTCGAHLSARNNSIEFWTPDGKALPFIANWESSDLWVDRGEVYHFGFDELKKVTLSSEGAKTVITSGPRFEEYRKNLEPYRQVLQKIGTWNSCYKCEDYFKKNLAQPSPGNYSSDTKSNYKSNSVQ
jgi:hypothetical protein